MSYDLTAIDQVLVLNDKFNIQKTKVAALSQIKKKQHKNGGFPNQFIHDDKPGSWGIVSIT